MMRLECVCRLELRTGGTQMRRDGEQRRKESGVPLWVLCSVTNKPYATSLPVSMSNELIFGDEDV